MVAVDHDAQQPPPSGGGHPHRFQVHPGRGHHRLKQASQAPVVHRGGGGAGATGHHDLLVYEPSTTQALIFAAPAYRPQKLHADAEANRWQTAAAAAAPAPWHA